MSKPPLSDDASQSRPAPVDPLASLEALLDQVRDAARREVSAVHEALNTVVRQQVAAGLAAEFLARDRVYESDALLASLIEQRLLDRAVFIQKRPAMLEFYRRLLLSFGRPIQSMLEIGVKGGGSTAFWKALFPEARIVGLDKKLQPWLTSERGADGVIYEEGDQSDATRLREIADRHGPFDVIIDDGSHVSDHQALSLRTLLPHVTGGGFYVIEDVHANLKKAGENYKVDYGEDIWADFVDTMFARLRHADLPPDTSGGSLARDVSRRVNEVILARRTLALRVVNRAAGPDA